MSSAGTNPRNGGQSPRRRTQSASVAGGDGDDVRGKATGGKGTGGKGTGGKGTGGKGAGGKGTRGQGTGGEGTRGQDGKVDHIVRTTIPSDFSAGRDVQRRILDAVDKSGFTAHSTFAIKLALEEALINAIKHGNNLDPDKNVHIEAIVSPSQAQITIEDEGPGFDRHSVPDPTLEENLEKCSGRGILLIEAYMNSVEWSRKGRRLRMVKRNGEEPAGR